MGRDYFRRCLKVRRFRHLYNSGTFFRHLFQAPQNTMFLDLRAPIPPPAGVQANIIQTPITPCSRWGSIAKLTSIVFLNAPPNTNHSSVFNSNKIYTIKSNQSLNDHISFFQILELWILIRSVPEVLEEIPRRKAVWLCYRLSENVLGGA